jgi:hypothetical protein
MPVDPAPNDTELTQTTIRIGTGESVEDLEITNGLLHDLYKSWAAASSYPSMGLNNFVAQIKQCIPSNHVQRRKVSGVVTQAKWVYLQLSPGCFTKNEINGLWQCNKNHMQDVGLSLFKRWAANFGQLHPYTPGSIPSDLGSGSGGTGGTGLENAENIHEKNLEENKKRFLNGQKNEVRPVPPDPLTTECGFQPSARIDLPPDVDLDEIGELI